MRDQELCFIARNLGHLVRGAGFTAKKSRHCTTWGVVLLSQDGCVLCVLENNPDKLDWT